MTIVDINVSAGKPMKLLQEKLLQFAKDRDWEKFQSPKNLTMALSVEVSELMEHFQWLSEDESRNLNQDQRDEVGKEIADVFLYTLLLAKRLDLDLYDEAEKKLLLNAKKYPAELVRGSAKKYTEYKNHDA